MAGRSSRVTTVVAALALVLATMAWGTSSAAAAGTASIEVTVVEETASDSWPWSVMVRQGSTWIGSPVVVWTASAETALFADLDAGTYEVLVRNYGFGQYAGTFFSATVVVADGEAATLDAPVDDRPTCPSYRVRTADGSALPTDLVLTSEQPGEGGTGFHPISTGAASSVAVPGDDPCFLLGGPYVVRVWTADGFGNGDDPLVAGFVNAEPGSDPTFDLVIGAPAASEVSGSADAHAYNDLSAGETVVVVRSSSTEGFTLTFPVTCPAGATPTSVSLRHGTTTVAAAAGGGTYAASLTRAQLVDGEALQALVTCPGPASVVQSVGRVVLFDPSGVITDAGTGDPIEGATVLLYKVDGWTPRTGPDDVGANTCESNASKAPGAEWSQLAAWEDAVYADVAAAAGETSPAVAEQTTGPDGAYGWDVAYGCWFVQVEAEGWASRTSFMVGVPPEVTDLDVELERIVPDTPANVQAVGGEAAATVSWNEVIENGAPITGYRVTVSPGGAVMEVPATSLSTVVPGLTPGTPYTFTVAARNAAGYGAESASAGPVTPGEPTGPTCDDTAFSDVDGSSSFCEDITWLVGEGITNGYADGTFRPGSGVTRQAIAAWLYRYAGQPEPPVGPCDTTGGFSDIPASHPFCHQIMWMVDAGLANGYLDGTFKPTNPISRQAMAAFLFRLALQVEEGSCAGTGFPDVANDHPFCHEIAWMVAGGITDGYADGTFRPTTTISRQAAAAFLHRFDGLGSP